MTVGLNQLLERIPRGPAFDFLLTQMQALGFETTGWASGKIQRTIVTLSSWVMADASEVVRQVGLFGSTLTATGSPLTELSRANFENTRHEAVRTVGPYTLANAGTTPYTIIPGQLLLGATTGPEFENTTGGTLAAGGTLTVTIRALKAGASGNVASNAITRLLTPLAGVTGNNPPPAVGVPWYTTAGADEEAPAALRLRNSSRMGTLNQIAMPGSGYEHLARSVTGIVKVTVDDQNPRGPNTLDVYIATASGPAGGGDIAAVQALVNAKRSPSCDALVLAPSTLSLNPAYIIDMRAGHNTSENQLRIGKAIDDYVSTVPIGGFKFSGESSGKMPLSELNDAITSRPGVDRVTCTSHVSDPSLTPLQLLVVGTKSLTFRTV
jgi:uncharacterized phage protein gp47/JayE